jgi:hypothetical protein
VKNEYLDEYLAVLEHQIQHGAEEPSIFGAGRGQPWEYCIPCVHEEPGRAARPHGVKLRYSWAVPNDAALDAIAEHSPGGVVEIGAGGGYWAGLLRDRGIDVVAYDPDPVGDGEHPWHDGRRWADVQRGDHTVVAAHPDRTLLLVWPSYGDPWTDQVLDLYAGDTVVYVGEGAGGCTGTGRMHALLGEGSYCWHSDDDDDCNCGTGAEATFEQIADVEIPQWAGLHDRLGVYRRLTATPRST